MSMRKENDFPWHALFPCDSQEVQSARACVGMHGSAYKLHLFLIVPEHT